MAKLFLTVGLPGSGKSTYLKNHCKENDVIVSRDAVRFSMVAEGEEYFSKEKEVFAKFAATINTNLKLGYDVFADATHLNAASRRKVLDKVKGYDMVGAIVMNTSLTEALRRNDNRTGREFVPHSVIRRMAAQFEFPDITENFDAVYEIKGE